MAASLSGMTLPSWASHLMHKLATPPLLLVQAYVNTLDLDLRTDVLATPTKPRPGWPTRACAIRGSPTSPRISSWPARSGKACAP